MLFTLFLIFGLITVHEFHEDEILNLPGLTDEINFKHYSGYLDAGNSKLHYWLVESKNDPINDPLILWLNGGPGCSSLDGLLSELGPYHVKNGGNSLYLNPYSWNNISNVLFLESPAGVGFSYSKVNDYSFNDDKVSLANYLALQEFFKKHPNLIKNSFYVTGESYGGIYVPTLTKRIMEGMPTNGINLKGFAIGNGLLSVTFNDQSVVYFAYFHTIIGEKLWEDILDYCCSISYKNGYTRRSDMYSCNFTVPQNPQCMDNLKIAWHMVFETGINDYSLYRPCDPTTDTLTSSSATYHKLKNFLKYFTVPDFIKESLNASFIQNNTKLSKILYNDSKQGLDKRNGKFEESVPCIDSSSLIKWLNRPDVKEAIHISPDSKKWDVCSEDVGSRYERIYENMEEQFRYILNIKGGDLEINTNRVEKYISEIEEANKRLPTPIRGLVYNGDTDMMCNFLGNQWFLRGLNLKQIGDHQPWYIDHNQVAGFVDYYENNLTFATVKGAGHMVPQWKPKEAYHMIKRFLENKEL